MNIFLAEFIGVTILIFIGCGVLAGNSLKKSGTYKIGSVTINLAWGFAVALAIYTVGDISGAHLNPAFTIAKALNGSFQILGISFGGVTGASLNPARDLGPRLEYLLLPIPEKGSSNFKYGWIPVLAPILGGSTGAMINLALYYGIVDLRLISIIAISIITLVIVKVTEKSRLIKLNNISKHSILNYNKI
ncbi:MIP/aquaporin family protein [Clostridium sp.]|uniref:MIP/aquaporin family protein n=1 Tax=Clostridium sp. TaxID=1506 RepID=UPI003440A3F1